MPNPWTTYSIGNGPVLRIRWLIGYSIWVGKGFEEEGAISRGLREVRRWKVSALGNTLPRGFNHMLQSPPKSALSK
jgi:hypothetical protein